MLAKILLCTPNPNSFLKFSVSCKHIFRCPSDTQTTLPVCLKGPLLEQVSPPSPVQNQTHTQSPSLPKCLHKSLSAQILKYSFAYTSIQPTNNICLLVLSWVCPESDHFSPSPLPPPWPGYHISPGSKSQLYLSKPLLFSHTPPREKPKSPLVVFLFCMTLGKHLQPLYSPHITPLQPFQKYKPALASGPLHLPFPYLGWFFLRHLHGSLPLASVKSF